MTKAKTRIQKPASPSSAKGTPANFLQTRPFESSLPAESDPNQQPPNALTNPEQSGKFGHRLENFSLGSGDAPPAIQQKPANLLKSAHQSIQSTMPSATTLLQMKSCVVNDETHLSELRDGTNIFGSPKLHVTKKEPVRSGDIVEISDTETDHRKEGEAIKWYKINPAKPVVPGSNKSKPVALQPNASRYIKAAKLYEGVTVGGQANNPEGGDDLLGSVNDNVLGTTTDGLDSFSKQVEEQKGDTSNLDISGGAFGTAGGILSMAISIKELVANGSKLEDWIATIWSGLVNTGKVTSGISKIVSAASGSENAKGTSDWSGGFAGAFETLGGGVKTIKTVIDLIKMWASNDSYAKSEYAKVGSEIVAGALSTAKGVVDTVKNFIDIFSGPTEALAQAIPGLDIAINATKMIMEGYYLGVSAYHWSKMRAEATKLEANYQDKDKLSKSKQEYQSKRAEISNLEVRALAKKAKNQTRTTKINELDTKITALTNRQTVLQQEIQSLERTPDSKEKKKSIEAKKKELTSIKDKLDGTMFSSGLRKEKTDLEAKRGITDRKIQSAEDGINLKRTHMDNYGRQNGIQQDDINELELADELRTGNRKRIVRQTIHLSSDAAKIVASITTLSGVGAVAGVSLKASAAGVDLSLPFFRSLKEYGRKKAAESQSKGETGTFSQWMFNANKSGDAKLAERKRHTATLFKMVNRLNTMPLVSGRPLTDPQKEEIQRVETFIKATGCEPRALYRLNGDSAAQATLVLQSLYKREF